MSQNAVVKRILNDGMVEVSLMRQMECGLSCNQSCESCGMRPTDELLAVAKDQIGTAVGDIIEVESHAGNPIAIAFAVFALPCVGLVAGYFFGQFVLKLSEAMSLLP